MSATQTQLEMAWQAATSYRGELELLQHPEAQRVLSGADTVARRLRDWNNCRKPRPNWSNVDQTDFCRRGCLACSSRHSDSTSISPVSMQNGPRDQRASPRAWWR